MRTRRAILLVPLVLVFAAPLVLAHGGSTVHSANVDDAHHLPAAPVEGQSVSIHVYISNDTRIESVRAVYCRVQRYACAPALLLSATSPKIYDGRIPWNSEFFESVTTVGYKFDIRYVDGTNESTPLTHFPSRPPDLPEGGDVYYYYTLTPAPESPGLGPAPLIVVTLLALAWRKRQ